MYVFAMKLLLTMFFAAVLGGCMPVGQPKHDPDSKYLIWPGTTLTYVEFKGRKFMVASKANGVSIIELKD